MVFSNRPKQIEKIKEVVAKESLVNDSLKEAGVDVEVVTIDDDTEASILTTIIFKKQHYEKIVDSFY